MLGRKKEKRRTNIFKWCLGEKRKRKENICKWCWEKKKRKENKLFISKDCSVLDSCVYVSMSNLVASVAECLREPTLSYQISHQSVFQHHFANVVFTACLFSDGYQFVNHVVNINQSFRWGGVTGIIQGWF